MVVITGCIATSVFAGLWCVLSRINDSLKSLVKIQDAIYNKLNKDEQAKLRSILIIPATRNKKAPTTHQSRRGEGAEAQSVEKGGNA